MRCDWGQRDRLEDAAGVDDAAELGDHRRRHAELLADDRLAAIAAVVRIAQLAVLGQLKLEKLVSKLAFVAHAVHHKKNRKIAETQQRDNEREIREAECVRGAN